MRSWIPRKNESSNVSKDFWMPDQSCRVCYECDSVFTLFNRKHHCRLCGRVFCAKCTENTVPASPDDYKIGGEESERLRVCNYCFKQWEQRIAPVSSAVSATSPSLSKSPSAASLASTQTCDSSTSSVGSTQYSTGPYKHVQSISSMSPRSSARLDQITCTQDQAASLGKSDCIDTEDIGYNMNRSDDEDDEYGVYKLHSEIGQSNAYYSGIPFDEIGRIYASDEHTDGESIDTNHIISTQLPETLETEGLELNKKNGEEEDEGNNCNASEDTPLHEADDTRPEPVDFENNGVLWLPPEPEDEDDEKEGFPIEDDDDFAEDDSGDGNLRSSDSFGSGEFRNRDRSSDLHKKAMKNVVDGHFRALIAQLLQVENLPADDSKESWLEIVTYLCWEAATLVKPDKSQDGGMDPGRYVKIKCIACGSRDESVVVKGVVCKKNVANKRMASKVEKPRFLILGGALEYQRVANHLSSVDTLLQQEMVHLKMAVAKIDAQHPNVLLVEKSVSRHAQDFLLAKGISLVLNIKRTLLESIARCTGAQIVQSIDHLTSQKLGYCDSFHVEKFMEVHGTAGQGGKKLTKTLMFFEGCPKPLGCTILLKGANGDELKKVKYVVQYGVFAAYHLAVETSFLADEGASLPELPLKAPIAVALPDKPSSIDRSISTVPGFTDSATPKLQGNHKFSEPCQPNINVSSSFNAASCKVDGPRPFHSKHPSSQPLNAELAGSSVAVSSSAACSYHPEHNCSDILRPDLTANHASNKDNKTGIKESTVNKISTTNDLVAEDNILSSCFGKSETILHGAGVCSSDGTEVPTKSLGDLRFSSSENHQDEAESLKEDFPPSPSDNQSILVSLSTRCVWKGTVCERAQLFRIKYYGNCDRPLGRFLRDHLFDQNYQCRSCQMPSEAHVHCYTHRQGSLTISVKKLPEFLLQGEREGKIWMWHRCLRCPRINGFPPATRRVLMSEAAWGLSFGKFLELSFSNHAAASRVASCGHSLHRDCLRFYGFGRMVACFRYASIDVNSVHLPPSTLEFNYHNQEWLSKEADEVHSIADCLFAEACNALHQISKKKSIETVDKVSELKHKIGKLERILQEEKAEFEESLRKVLKKNIMVGKPNIDILEINRLRKQLIFHAYIWDQRLTYISNLNNSMQRDISSCASNPKEKLNKSVEKPAELSKASSDVSCSDSSLKTAKSDIAVNQSGQSNRNHPDGIHKGATVNEDNNRNTEAKDYQCSNLKIAGKHDSLVPVGSLGMIVPDGQFRSMGSLSDTLDAAWSGESHSESISPKEYACNSVTAKSTTSTEPVMRNSECKDRSRGVEAACSLGLSFLAEAVNKPSSWVEIPFLSIYQAFQLDSSVYAQKSRTLCEYNPTYILSFLEFVRQGGARVLLPAGINDIVVPVYDDEPTSIISYALVSPEYHIQVPDEPERLNDGLEPSLSLPILDSVNLLSLNSFNGTTSESLKTLASADESFLSMPSSQASSGLDSLSYNNNMHAKVSFTDEGPLGKVKYTVTCYCARRFKALRKICCNELDYIRSLSRCKKWGAQGGKSNVFFAKTLDDRFIIKQVTKTELESFIDFAPEYFKYLSESITSHSPTCLAKILGIYQVTLKHLKGGKESRIDVLVMENLLFRRNITRLYDLKGSSRSRYNPDSSGSNKVLLDQNLIEAMPTSPIFVGNKAKRLLERAVWNDTAFLASIDVMDYSLLVGLDEENHELVLGIIDFMRQYTWDKHLETWVKASGILGGPKNASPTVISPKQYKKRFRKAMAAYFLMVPDQWSPQTNVSNDSLSDFGEDRSPGVTSIV